MPVLPQQWYSVAVVSWLVVLSRFLHGNAERVFGLT